MSLSDIRITFKEVNPIERPSDVKAETRLFEIESSENIWNYDCEKWLDKHIKNMLGPDWKFNDGFPLYKEGKEVEMIEAIKVS